MIILITGVRTQRDSGNRESLEVVLRRENRLVPHLEAVRSLEFPTCLFETRLTGPW